MGVGFMTASVEELTPADLTPAERKRLERELGSMFGLGERLFGSFTEDDVVSLAWDVEPQDFAEMLAADGNARKIERVLSLPIRGAPWHITGTGPAADLVRQNVGPMLGKLIEQCTGAIVYRRSFFEKVWTTNDAGQIVYKKLAWRPPNACSARFDRQTGVERGFYQRITDAAWWGAVQRRDTEGLPGQITIEKRKAFVYTHGRHREPVKGVSDLEVAYNAYTKKRKLKFLWMQFIENQSLPKIGAFGKDPTDAQRNAEALAKGRASSIIPMVREPDQGDPFAIIESSGRGAGQFVEALRYFDWEQTNSVLAGFTELANSSSGTGSYALSADQSEFFLASEQALADEIADQIVESVFTPLVVLNFGPDAEVPQLRIGPIGRQQTDRALDLLKEIVTATRPTVPYEFIGFLLVQVAEQLGLDVSEVEDLVKTWGEQMQDQMQAAQAAQAAAASQPSPLESVPTQPPLTGTREAEATTADGPAVKPVNAMKAPARHPSKKDQRRSAARLSAVELAAEKQAEAKHTGGMVALFPDAATVANLRVDGGEDPEDLHLTLCYLGDDVTGWSDSQRAQVVERARLAAGSHPPAEGRVFAHATFNPDAHADRKPCAVYLVGDTEIVPELHAELRGLASALQHPGFVPHVTGVYGKTAEALSYTGPVRFDRIVVCLGDDRTEIPLTGLSQVKGMISG